MSTGQAWRDMRRGDVVRVAHPETPFEHELKGKLLSVVKMELVDATTPEAGWVADVLAPDGGVYWVRAQSLEYPATWEVRSARDGLEGVFATPHAAHDYASMLTREFGERSVSVTRVPKRA